MSFLIYFEQKYVQTQTKHFFFFSFFFSFFFFSFFFFKHLAVRLQPSLNDWLLIESEWNAAFNVS